MDRLAPKCSNNLQISLQHSRIYDLMMAGMAETIVVLPDHYKFIVNSCVGRYTVKPA
jgi:hypothetical protein